MLVLGPIGFTAPWLLWGLAALPVLWLLLRAIPPAPIRRRFPGVALLLGLADEEQEADRTPWWLLLLRMLAVAAMIAGFAGPVLNPEVRTQGGGPLFVVTDGSWASARDWSKSAARIAAAVDEAGRSGRSVAVVSLTDVPPGGPVFAAADAVAEGLPAIQPKAWEPAEGDMARLTDELPEGGFDTLWLSDGIARAGRAELLASLMAHGAVTAVEASRGPLALGPPVYEGGTVSASVLRARKEGEGAAEVVARGLDPAGIERELARAEASFTPGDGRAVAEFDLPPELRNRLTRFEIAGETSAGAVTLADDALKRRKVAIITSGAAREGLELLAPDHFLRQALVPTADVIEGTVGDVLLAAPDVIILADVAKVAEVEPLTDWIEEGGLLVRFAGPHLAASDVGRDALDPLLPVRLRSGGRSVGGTMSWGEPKALAAFPEGSPFAGLVPPDDVVVSAQVLAEPGPDLAAATIATLADGTPLVTRRQIGDGQVVLFHVSANAEWTSLPLSGLFVQMLERLAISSNAARPKAGTSPARPGRPSGCSTPSARWERQRTCRACPAKDLAESRVGPDVQPGLYGSGDRRLALNVISADRELAAAEWPAGVAVEGLVVAREQPMKGWVLTAALALLLVDLVASLALAGRLRGACRSCRAGIGGAPAGDGPARSRGAGWRGPRRQGAARGRQRRSRPCPHRRGGDGPRGRGRALGPVGDSVCAHLGRTCGTAGRRPRE